MTEQVQPIKFKISDTEYTVNVPRDTVFPVHALLMDKTGFANVQIAGLNLPPTDVINWIPTNEPVLLAYPKGYVDPFKDEEYHLWQDLL